MLWWICLWCLQGPATAAVPSPKGDGRDLPCAQDSPELVDATHRLHALDRQIRNLKPGDNHTAANEALIALSGHRCMLLSRIAPDQLRAEAAPALINFWDNGGKYWIESHLELATKRSISRPPAMRKVVATETRPGHPVVSMLCPLGDQACGEETNGWWRRAETFFRLKAAPIPRARRIDPANPDMTPPWQAAPSLTEEDCRKDVITAPDAERFSFWDRCVDGIRKAGFLMPLGRLKAPTSGWLVVRGRRGHYGYCDEVRMYSLATGDAYISSSCSHLMQLIAGNGVPDRKRQVARGSVLVDNIREVAWMLLQQRETIDDFVNGDNFTIPAGIDPVKGSENPFLSVRPTRLQMVSSDQTTLAWALTDAAGKNLDSGKVTFPSDYLGGPNDHALELLQIAEAGFSAGCPREKPPESLGLGDARPVVSALDANSAELSRAERDLMTDLYKTADEECALQR
jgi:hypothetical protein